jgi:ABC-type dipeptide/oligopeptide/nickel transport system ATPase subunit
MPQSREAYESQKKRVAARNEKISREGRDIGKPPAVKSKRKRNRCQKSFLQFCLTYLKSRFPLKFSADHLEVIQTLETTVLAGGQYAFAMPRGSGKSTLCEACAVWAVVYGHRRFIVLIGASEKHADQMLDSIKIEIETNDLLYEDFPEVVHPVRALQRISNRAAGQTCEGEPTHLEWSTKSIVIATIAGSKASGTTIQVAGITGRIRGMKHVTAQGESLRPDLVITDDPQTDESAASASQNESRERMMAGAVLGLAGPGEKIAAAMPCTVIEPGDMADRILDRERHPEWNGKRYKLMYAMPKEMKLWDEYERIRRESMRAGTGISPATEFYRLHRDAMDVGASVAWAERFRDDELSAVQHAMNLLFTDQRSFQSEYQNEPLSTRATDDSRELVADEIAGKLSRLPMGVVPANATRLTAFIDVQGNCLFAVVVAWDERFGGTIIHYGTWPEQQRAYFRATDVVPDLATIYPGYAREAAIYAGLRDLCGRLIGRLWRKVDSEESLRVERCLIDSGWGESTELVYQYCQQSEYAAVVLPSKGIGIGASGVPMSDWSKKPGERHGLNWMMRPPIKGARLVRFDTNWWKSFSAARLQTPFGSPGCLALWGERAADHQLFADHCLAEFRVKTFGRGREVEEWKIRPEKPDNHWWDCVVGAAVAASVSGLQWSAESGTPGAEIKPSAKAAPRVKLSDLQKQKRGNHGR